MADEPTDQPEDTLELTEEEEIEQPEGGDDQPEADEGDLVIGFEGDPEPDPDSDQPGDNSAIRALRQQLREEKRRRKELEQASAPPPVQLGPKPTLAGHDYDEEQFEAALDAWKEEKRKADEHVSQAEVTQAENAKAWEEAGKRYQEGKAALAVDDHADAEAAVEEALGPTAALIAMAARDPAKMVYALGKSPARLAELAKLKNNPIKLAAEIARLEGGVTMKKRTPPNPDKPASGSAPMPGGTDKQMAKLEKEAERSGDRTALIRYRREKGL